MLRCPRCESELPARARFCPECGAVLSAISELPTALATPSGTGAPPVSSSGLVGRLESSGAIVVSAFAPGDVLLERYRIVGLIGRGGMGEVYRADDLKLGQAVSLKFLPDALARDPAMLDRFRAEVRNARQVSHPNVCRVYDIGEYAERHFLTMEYVDGEDLATLLRRIGRLPAAKAGEVARQLCAGLAAAHDKGVLHRDLKPSNVMIDGNGRVRITDFGLAVRHDEAPVGEMAGTPAYMAPELFRGEPATVRSDLYALGLVLYEVYTGHRPFDAASLPEWRQRHTNTPPPSPTSFERDVDPNVESAILRCLDKDPSRRPASALQLAAALPGGDPLAAALAAGQTPSPEMVAAAGGEGAVAPRVAWSLLLALMVACGALLAITPWATDLGLARMQRSTASLRDQARDLAARFGYARQPLDSAWGIGRDYDPMKYRADHEPSTRWRATMMAWGPPIYFWYRQSPRWMSNADGQITTDQPEYDASGMVCVITDTEGRLRYLRAVPPQKSRADSSRTFDWSALFQAAGLPLDRFRRVEPEWLSPEPFDARAEWAGSVPAAPQITLRVAAAAYQGRPVYFRIFGPWSRAARMEAAPRPLGLRIGQGVFFFLLLLLLVSGVGLAHRNLRLGRGDRKGALRMAVVAFALAAIRWTAVTHHVPAMEQEVPMFLEGLADASLLAMLVAMLYLAVEPYMRRQMPELLIGWARLIEGKWRDPRVGRDVLIGALTGTAAVVVLMLGNALPSWIDVRGQTTVFSSHRALAGGRYLVSFLADSAVNSMFEAFMRFGFYFLLRLVLRNTPAAVTGLFLLNFLSELGGENVALETPGALVMAALGTVVIARFGLLASIAGAYFRALLALVPLPLDSGAPYAASTMITLLILLGIALYAFRTSIGPRPLFALQLDD